MKSKHVKMLYWQLLSVGLKTRDRKSIPNVIRTGSGTEPCRCDPTKCSFISRFNDISDPQTAERRTLASTHAHIHTQKRRIDRDVKELKSNILKIPAVGDDDNRISVGDIGKVYYGQNCTCCFATMLSLRICVNFLSFSLDFCR
jgi:hypothetical protein